MVAVWHGLMAAPLPMPMPAVVVPAIVPRRAVRRVLGTDRQTVIVNVVAMRVMQVTVVEVIRVALVTDSSVAAVGPVLMPVTRVNVMLGPRSLRHCPASANGSKTLMPQFPCG
jgi:hypothetical protein